MNTGAIRNNWGDNETVVSQADVQKGLHSKYMVGIKSLTYKGYSTGDIPMIWEKHGQSCNIYQKSNRDASGIAGIEKMFNDLCQDFGLDTNGNVIQGGGLGDFGDF